MFYQRAMWSIVISFLVSVCGYPQTLSASNLPDIVFIVSDDQRPDTVGVTGNQRIRTPNLDRLAKVGTTFTRAYTGYPICYASRAQILTGCNAFTALVDYPKSRVDPALNTLAETLSSAGYQSIYSGKWHNDGHPLERGYDRVAALYSAGGGARGVKLPELDDRQRPLTGYRGWTFKDQDNQPQLRKGVGLLPDNSRQIADGVIGVIQAGSPSQPLFLHVNFAFPHDPRQWPQGMRDSYLSSEMRLPSNFREGHGFDHGNQGGRDEVLLPRPLKPSDVREELAIYYAMVSDVDRQVGRIVEALKKAGRLGRTLFVYTSDQGLALGSHGLLGKQNQYEHSICSPLIMVGPSGFSDSGSSSDNDDLIYDLPVASWQAVPSNKRVSAIVELSDLFPTFCDFAGISVPPTVQGKSLLPLLSGRVSQIHQSTFGVFTHTQRMICNDRWKYILYPQAKREQLFDLLNDPDELEDRSQHASCQDIVVKMREELESWRLKHHDPILQSGK